MAQYRKINGHRYRKAVMTSSKRLAILSAKQQRRKFKRVRIIPYKTRAGRAYGIFVNGKK